MSQPPSTEPKRRKWPTNARCQASATAQMRSALFWDFAQRKLVVFSWHFQTSRTLDPWKIWPTKFMFKFTLNLICNGNRQKKYATFSLNCNLYTQILPPCCRNHSILNCWWMRSSLRVEQSVKNLLLGLPEPWIRNTMFHQNVSSHYHSDTVITSRKTWILKHTTVKLACIYEIETQDQPEKYNSICSDSQAALKALQAAKTMSPLVRQCQKALNGISIWHTMGLYWVLGHAGVCGSEITHKLARGSSTKRFIGPEPSLGVSTQNINNNNIKRWVDN